MIRIRRSDDLQAVHEMDRLCFPADKPLTDAELAGSTWWIAQDEQGADCAYAACDSKGFLHRVGVLPAYRGQGLQKRFIRVVLRYARRAGLPAVVTYVLASNLPSLNSFLALGFRVTRAENHPHGVFLHLARRVQPHTMIA